MRSKHGSLECAILNILWEMEKNNIYTNSVKDVYETLKNTDGEMRAYTTIKTVMDRLHKKEVLLRFKQKNKFYYRTAYSKKDMLSKSVNDIADLFCGGSLELLACAVNTLVNEAKAEETLVGAV